jgi:hypothetical protein
MKPSKQRRAVTDAESQRLNVRLDAEAYRRLMIHCVMSGTQPGKFLASLIDTHCRAWRVQAVAAQVNRSASVPSDGRLDLDASVSREALENATAA